MPQIENPGALMGQLIQQFFKITFFRAGPQSLPSSASLWRLLFVINALLSIVYLNQRFPLNQSISNVFVVLLVVYCLLRLLLAAKMLSSRFNQTFSAILGADIILKLVEYVLVGTGLLVATTREVQTLQLGIIAWALAIQGYILRHALKVSFFVGVVLSMWMMLVCAVVLSYLTPNPMV